MPPSRSSSEQKGFHETTLKAVADRAEFSVGSVYSFFESKEDLFRQVFVRRGGQFLAEMRAVLTSGQPADQMHRLVDMQIDFFRRHVDFGRLVLRYFTITALPTEGPLSDAVAVNFDEAMGLQADLFDRGQRSGALHPGDPRLQSRLLSGMVLSFQSVDLAVVPDEPDRTEPMSRHELHEVVDRAFVDRAFVDRSTSPGD